MAFWATLAKIAKAAWPVVKAIGDSLAGKGDLLFSVNTVVDTKINGMDQFILLYKFQSDCSVKHYHINLRINGAPPLLPGTKNPGEFWNGGSDTNEGPLEIKQDRVQTKVALAIVVKHGMEAQQTPGTVNLQGFSNNVLVQDDTNFIANKPLTNEREDLLDGKVAHLSGYDDSVDFNGVALDYGFPLGKMNQCKNGDAIYLKFRGTEKMDGSPSNALLQTMGYITGIFSLEPGPFGHEAESDMPSMEDRMGDKE